MPAPLMFIGSSTEGLNIANALLESLGDDITGLLWTQIGFELSADTLTTIEGNLRQADCAAFIFAHDDELEMRGERAVTVRDNVLFECGLAIGILGRKQTFIVQPKDSNKPQRTASDLLGLTVAEYDLSGAEDSAAGRRRALLPAANRIRAAVRELTPAPVGLSGEALALPGRHQWGQVFESFVDAAFYTKDDSVAQREILDSAGNGTLVPGRYLYSSDPGAKNWIQLCRDPMYRHHSETANFWRSSAGREIAGRVRQKIGSNDFDYVSLGPGNGQKDLDLITYWLGAGADLYYYPYDISLPLVSQAVRRVCEKTSRPAASRLHIKAVLADFSELATMREVFHHRENPNVVALLGNSLGNLAQDRGFLHDLRSSMSPSDILVIEVRLQSSNGQLPELATNQAMRFDFGALEHYLGVPFDKDKMTVENLPNAEDERRPSDIDNTITTIVGCDSFECRGEQYADVKLIYIHQYTEEDFLSALKQVGFEVLESRRGGQREGFLVCVARPMH